MDKITQLLYSYIRTATKLADTGDTSYKKTLGMFRMRLKDQGVLVKSLTDDGDFITLELEVNGVPQTERMQKSPGEPLR